MAKRSPILGYNHNVRYRGLVFHVQTEDSGLLSPHLFTHLFHGGVIISTRKLVYDAGAAEDAIKSLMQAQHKAVLKDLKKGSFDDKIDQYLGGTPGLLPRGEGDDNDASGARSSDPVLATPPAGTPIPKPLDRTEPAGSRQATIADEPPQVELAPPATRTARTKTAERGSAPSAVRTNLPPPPPNLDELGGPTLDDPDTASIAAAVAAANATVQARNNDSSQTIPVHMPPEMSPPEIELELDADEPPQRRTRDTEVGTPQEDVARVGSRRPGESVPPLPPPPPTPNAHPRASSALGAAALKPPPTPTRPPSRPAITPPQVVSRPLAPRNPDESGAVEVYAPAPPSVDPPPGMAPGERPGQYAQHKRVSQKMPAIDIVKERSGSTIPSGLARPGKPSSPPSSGVPRPIGSRDSSPHAVPPRPPGTGPAPVVRNNAATPPAAVPAAPNQTAPRARTPTPQRVPAPSRTASSSSGVVMTRPAVIVGAPAKPAQPPRVRMAREDEGRGFGQGLISEKSLDEVILAYLSEDADEK